MRSLKEVNVGLAETGIPVVLSLDSAALVTKKIGRDDFIMSLKKAMHGDAQARGFIEVNLSKLGLLGQAATNDDAEPDHCSKKPRQDTAAYGSEEREFLSHHVYGTDALCFQIDKTKNDFYTIRIDAAKSASGKQKKWSDKISIQLTMAELPVVVGVLMKVRDKCEFKAHGPNKDKGFTMEVQDEKVFCRVFAKDKPVVNVPIPYADRVHIVALFYRQILKQYPWMDGMSVSALVRI